MKFDRNKLMAWYAFLKREPCCHCGTWGTAQNPIEAAHLQMMVSRKTGAIMPRSHKTEAAWACVPLCRNCHLAQHEVGERVFFLESLIRPPEVWGSLLVRFFVGEDETP